MTTSFTVLGSSATFPRPDNPCSGYLLQTSQAALWADAGSGTFAMLQRYLDPRELSAAWLSHLHPDHCADLLSAFNWSINTPDAHPLPIYGPAGWAARLASMLPNADALELVHKAFDVHELHDGQVAHVGDLVLRSYAVQHSVPAFGLRATTSDAVIGYSGDSGPCPSLNEIARNADLFVCEAGATQPQPSHCTASEAAEAAVQGGSRRLLLTHLADGVDPNQALEVALQLAGCPVDEATPGSRFDFSLQRIARRSRGPLFRACRSWISSGGW